MEDPDEVMDAQLASVIEDLTAAGVPPWHAMSVPCARRIEDEMFSTGAGPELESVRDFAIDGPGGHLPVRVYRPDVEDPPTLLFYHGGGWVLGTLDSADGICRELASRGKCLVLSVDYRLAPEHPFPAAVDDAFVALQWATDHAGALGGDSTRLGVAGTSAGGNLAAATALRVRDEGASLDGQFLLYPITDHTFDTSSYREHSDAPLLSRADMAWFWRQYLRSPVDAHNPFAAPVRAQDLSGVAPATVLTAGFDVLRDEGVTYAERLTEAGVPTRHDHYPTLAHGFLSLTDSVDLAAEAMDELATHVQSRLH